MAELVGDGFETFTPDEIAQVKSVFPSITQDAKLLDEINKLRKYIWSSCDAGHGSPSGSIAAVALLARQVDRLSKINSDEAAIMKALHDSFSQQIKVKLRPETPVTSTSQAIHNPGNYQTEAEESSLQAITKSIAFREFEEALDGSISTLFQLKDGTSYKYTLMAHFYDALHDYKVPAVGATYKMFALMAQEETLLEMLEGWRGLVHSQEIENNNAMVTGLQANVQYWDAIYKLELHKADFLKELEQYPSAEEKVKIINQQITILGAGKELQVTTEGVTVASHVEHLFCVVASKYGLSDRDHQSRNKQGLLAKHLVDVYGNGILGLLALDGYKSMAQDVQADIVPHLAQFTKTETHIQTLFDWVSKYLVEPILSNEPVSEHGERRFCELLMDGDWSSMTEEE